MASPEQPIDFRFSICSTYSYLSVMRLPDVARREGLLLAGLRRDCLGTDLPVNGHSTVIF